MQWLHYETVLFGVVTKPQPGYFDGQAGTARKVTQSGI
jgi:hypothetical protein